MAQDNNKSDYNKPFMDLLKYLPEPNLSDVNESLFSNLFNRFLTKQEVKKVSGYIGEGNPAAVVSRQIQENDVHRQAFQLQPILNDKIGSVEHMASWKDIQNELTRLGVDMGDFAKWGAVQKFNWVPPIDINKIINFSDYYWDDDNNNKPQYITIRSRCAVATSRKNFWENIIVQYGESFPVVDILPAESGSTQTFNISAILTTSSPLTGQIIVTGDVTTDISLSHFIVVGGTVNHDGVYQVTANPSYSGTTNETTITVDGLPSGNTGAVGTVTTRRFDQIVFGANTTIITGDYTTLLEKDFILFLSVQGNTALNNTFVKVIESIYNSDDLTTTIQFDSPVTDDNFNVGSIGSLNEQLSIFTAAFNCLCGELAGWDDGILWDDNPESPLWGDSESTGGSPFSDGISDHQNLLDRITNAGPPTGTPADTTLWYDTVTDILYQYSTAIGWKLIWNNFSLLLEATTGTTLWDQLPTCDNTVRIPAVDQWISENMWKHKNDITNFAGAVRATQPIIEYDWDLELNEWTSTNYNWAYRSEESLDFVDTDLVPAVIELEPIDWWEQSGTTTILDFRYGDLTDYFHHGKRVYIGSTTSAALVEVDFSEYKTMQSGQQYRTYITFKTVPINTTGDLANLQPNTFVIFPFETAAGDTWQEYNQHWLLRGADDAVPVPHEVENPFAVIDINTPWDTTTLGYDTRKTFYAQEYSVTNVGSPLGASYFELSDGVLDDGTGSPTTYIDTRALRRKSLFGFDDVKVYVADINGVNVVRQFGNYEEVEEVVLDVLGINVNTFSVPEGTGQYFTNGSPNTVLELSNNTTVGTTTYTVLSSTTNSITVNESLAGVDANGEIRNITLPLSSKNYPSASFTPSQHVTFYLMGIEFISPIPAGLNVLIKVGPSTINELGSTFNKVRMIENDEVYDLNGNVAVSQTTLRKVEQIKTKTNQYPLFDIFTSSGAPAYKASPIFGYRTDPSYDVNQTGLRIVVDPINQIYEFDQFLLESDNSELLAYRDYGSTREDFWYNPETMTVFFWKDTEWSDKTVMGDFYRRAVISPIEPEPKERNISGLYWYNTTSNILYKRFISGSPSTGVWSEIQNIDTVITDKNLQTIWRAGPNKDLYVPEKVDWIRRSESEYNIQRNDFINTRSAELLIIDSSLTLAEAIILATKEWHDGEAHALSPTGTWIGDWEIPDPLYYNNLHENRKFLNSRELLTHFSTIVEEQPKLPGFSGSAGGMFALLPLSDVNYSLGGTIKEFNDGFDTLLSSTFVNNVTPRSLIEFAHDQYEVLLNSLKEIYRRNAINLLTNIEPTNILNLSGYVASETITLYELNDQYAFIYGDSTTFTDVDGVNDLGVRNWIATLPYVNLIEKQYPSQTVDNDLGINEVVHHDGHRTSYELSPATTDIIYQIVVSSPDPRTTNKTMGTSSSSLPANDISEFQNAFSSNISNREGVYWYYLPAGTTNIMYRYVVVESGITTPSDTFADGTLWMDLTPTFEVLRIKKTDNIGIVSWDVVDGLVIGDGRLHNGTTPLDVTTATISAWEVVDLNALLSDTIFTLENRLYENVPDIPDVAYDLSALPSLNPVKYNQYLEEAFLDYVSQSDISTPLKNTGYNATDPFTWNYKRSADGGPLTIISADGLTNSFLVAGPYTPPTSFFVKNSGVNDGTWKTILPSIYNGTTTTIFVDGDVIDSLQGIIHSGYLPSEITSTTLNNLNDGSESGGDWRDLYTKFYNTPYPNSEPWKLQGYIEKPFWWDVEYLNDDEAQWGKRTWKYKHGFEIVGAANAPEGQGSPPSQGVISIDGNFVNLFIAGDVLPIDDTIDHPSSYDIGIHKKIDTVVQAPAGFASIIIDDSDNTGLLTYFPGMIFTVVTASSSPIKYTLLKEYTILNVIHTASNLTITVVEEILVGDIPSTAFINAAMYNPAINRTEIKLTTNVLTLTASGRIVKNFGMWENIRVGVIPPARTYPNGIVSITGIPLDDNNNGLSVPILPIFNYFSVNISNATVTADAGTTNYTPDGLFPPYWASNSAFSGSPNPHPSIRSLFTIYNQPNPDIVAPEADYVFGDSGPVEWQWRTSSQFQYDQLTIAYRIDPTRYVSSTFGFDYTEIGDLQIDRGVKNTPSHTRTNFHGDVVADKPFISNGLNQWYINFNRYNGYDANFSDFNELWTGWKAPLTYQFASFVDTPSLSIGHRFVDITNFDYTIKSKRAPGVDDFWLDAFKISIINIPYNIARYDNQIDWRFEVKTNIPISRNIKYYDVHNYQFYVDPTTDVCTLYSWKILTVDVTNKTFTVNGDQTQVFTTNSQFSISSSTGNDGIYDVSTVSYDLSSNRTSILVNNSILSSTADGILKADYRKIPWKTGDGIYVSTSETLPIPLLGDTVNGLTKYFIVVYTDTTFGLAMTKLDAESAIVIDITTTGRADHFVGEVMNTFTVTNSNTNWRFYALDKTNVLEYNTPHEIQGMQNLTNMINGYDAYMADSGWVINSDNRQLDPDTSNIVNWRVETERFISYAYSQRLIREQVNDRYPVTFTGSPSVWEFVGDNRTFITGDSVTVISSNGVYPTPLSRNIRYYMIRDALDVFRLAATKQDAFNSIAIDVTSPIGVGDLQISIPREFRTLIPEFELNAFRNAIWFNPPRGIVSDILNGPNEDIRSNQLIFNQNGNRIGADQLRVYRQDKETKISVVDASGNEDPSLLSLINPDFSLLHLGGMHLFIDAYEHVLVLENYTSEGNLLYDPFIGLNVTKYEALFNKQVDFTHRPNVGGYYLETFFNQGASIKENFEASVENLRNAYDTFNTFETNLMTEYSRRGLGYEGATDYLTNLNLSQKSQFIFWRGQIQNKGAINAVNAFINSRRFIDAKIDDFWAIKVGEFGSIAEKEFPEMFVTTVDARSNELRLEFVDNETDLDIAPVEESFIPIKMSFQERWYNQPDQIKVLRDNGKVMYFDMKAKNKSDEIVISGSPIVKYIKHDLDCDSVEITQYNSITLLTDIWKEGTDYNIINNNIVEILTISGGNIIIWGLVVNHDAQNPARIIDRESETQISSIQFWDPARGIHYSNAIHNVDLQHIDADGIVNNDDPAEYTNTLRNEDAIRYSGNWKDEMVGTTWLNIRKLDYLPYYSEQMIPDATERFRSWGQLADWAEYEIFEWVESDVPPSEWDVLAQSEEGDRSIVEHLRKSGTARRILLEPSVTGSPLEWIPAVNKFEEQYVAIAAVDTGTAYVFTVPLTKFKGTGSPLQYLVNIYINGKLFDTSVDINVGSPTGIITISKDDIKINDVIRFVQPIPTTQEDIDIAVANGDMLQDYEYSKVDFIDNLGTTFSKYYFWVSDKRTKPIGRNRTMPIAEAVIQLNSIPSAHMFFQKPVQLDEVSTESEYVPREEVHVVDGSPLGLSFALGTAPSPTPQIIIEVNGVPQPTELGGSPAIIYEYFPGSPASITLTGVAKDWDVNNSNLVPIVAGDIVKISYVGTFNRPINLPPRFTQAVIRGLQGVVNADNRYTIRFSRNFTLRDTIDIENVNLASLDLKELHEEWKVFRQEQQFNIDRWQWDRVIESIVGFKLADPAVRVPSYERELYDEKFNTDTQYGLEDGQSFANGSLALSSIIAYLLDPDVDFYPIDINTFFTNNSFDTTENIIKAMDEIYNTFIFTNINRMYFSVLHDAFTTKAKYPGLFKTSMVSLHGIRPFQNSGSFDD